MVQWHIPYGTTILYLIFVRLPPIQLYYSNTTGYSHRMQFNEPSLVGGA